MHHPLIRTPNGSSEYYITSVGSGLNLATAPGVLPPHAIVLLVPDIQPPKFTVTAADADNTYTIKVSGDDVRDLNDRVYSFRDGRTDEWVITFRETEEAYTVHKEVGCRMLAWTDPLERPEGPDPMQILLQDLCTSEIPPQQLFKFRLAQE